MSPKEVLQTYWHYDDFRPLQAEIIDSVLAGKDTLALMPTGGGKSLCFQVPTMVKDGLCLVVTPLIALMKDQVANLRSRDIFAAAIYTGMSRDQQRVALDNCQFGPYHFLYVFFSRKCSRSCMSSATAGVAVAVSASTGTSGRLSRMSAICRYDGRKS